MKVYQDKNVLEAAFERLEFIFDEFDKIYFSVSGGKDSSVMVQLANMIAKKKNKYYDVLYVDLEAQYKATIKHIEELKQLSNIRTFYHVALPIALRNAVSQLQPKWICWDEDVKHLWVRDMPENVINIHNNPFPFFRKGEEFEEFIIEFAIWYKEQFGGKVACGVGIRSDESLNRWRTIASQTKETYKGNQWTTLLKVNQKPIDDVYNFYPIYDWRTEDIWGAVAKLNLKFNEIYDMMYKNGLSIHEQRLCQPYGDDQRNGLDQFKALEYETWEKVLNRVNGVNFGCIYARSSLLGNLKSEKPDHMTWEQYAVFLLESIGLYNKDLMIHYYEKIKKFIKWWDKEKGINANNMPDDKWELKGYRQTPYWKRIARAIERNDFYMKRLSFSQTKSDDEKLKMFIKKYRNLLAVDVDSTDKDLRKFALKGEKNMITKIFKPPYDKTEFYSIMGKYFAEKEYTKELPYIYNDNIRIWYLFYQDNILVSFASVTPKKDIYELSNMYVEKEYRNKKIWSYMADYFLIELKGKTVRVMTNLDYLKKNWQYRNFIEVGNKGSYTIFERVIK